MLLETCLRLFGAGRFLPHLFKISVGLHGFNEKISLVYGAPFVKILYLTDLAQKLLSLAEIAISACRDVICGRDSDRYLCRQRYLYACRDISLHSYLCMQRCYLWQR